MPNRTNRRRRAAQLRARQTSLLLLYRSEARRRLELRKPASAFALVPLLPAELRGVFESELASMTDQILRRPLAGRSSKRSSLKNTDV